jgi:hypothetical protein
MKKLSYAIIGIACIGGMLFSCKKETTTPTTTTPTTTLDTTKVISYKTDIASLMSQECTSCHNNSNTSGGVNLSSYANVSKFASSSLSAINAGIMPPSGKWSADKIAVFSKWITQGKPNN